MATKKKPIKVALHGMDSRATKTMDLFLQGPCNGAAVIATNPNEADIDIFEGDMPASKRLLKKHFEESQQKPVVILSLWDVEQEGVLHVRKPIDTENMLLVLGQAKKLIDARSKKAILRAPKAQNAIDKVLDEDLAPPQTATQQQASNVDTLDEVGDWFETGWSDF